MADQAFIIAESFEPKIRLAMLNAFATIKDSVTLDELETVLRDQGIGGMQRFLNDMQIEGIIEENITDELNNAIMESGRATFNAIPNGLKTGQVFRYDLINPATAQYVRNYELSLVQKISANTREAIRNNIEASVISGQNPKTTARKFRDTIGLTPNQERAVQNYEKALRSMDKSSLNRALRDKRFDSTVLRSIKNNQPLSDDQIERMVTRYRERYIKYRAETIARTESLRAVSVGDYTSALQAVNEGAVERERLKRFWVYTRGKRTRQAHRQIPSMNPLGVYIDEPFQTPLGPLMFPRDPNGTASNTINCLHPDSIVNFASPKALLRRFYKGKMITIKTHGGHELTVTPNHPILWRSGWIQANALKKGDSIIGCNLGDITISNHDIENIVPRIEDIYNSGKISASVRDSGGVVNFHGETTDENVDIISFNSGLRGSTKAFFRDPFKEFRLALADKVHIFSPRSRSVFNMFLRLWPFRSSGGFIGRFNLVRLLFLGHLRPFKDFSFASGSMRDPVVKKNFVYSTPLKPGIFKNLINRITTIKPVNNFFKSVFVPVFKSKHLGFGIIPSYVFKNRIKSTLGDIKKLLKFTWGDSFKVKSFNVVSIHKFNYSGYVYNLEDDKSYYICNGLVNKNCRCAVRYKLVEPDTQTVNAPRTKVEISKIMLTPKIRKAA